VPCCCTHLGSYHHLIRQSLAHDDVASVNWPIASEFDLAATPGNVREFNELASNSIQTKWWRGLAMALACLRRLPTRIATSSVRQRLSYKVIL
jgi:hypothetical protein